MDDGELKALGDKARAARKALGKGVRQRDVADRAGVSLGVISNLERGETLPQPAHRRAIADVLGQDIFGEATARATSDEWDPMTRAYVDAIGLYLHALPPEQRAAQVATWMSEIIAERASSDRAAE